MNFKLREDKYTLWFAGLDGNPKKIEDYVYFTIDANNTLIIFLEQDCKVLFPENFPDPALWQIQTDLGRSIYENWKKLPGEFRIKYVGRRLDGWTINLDLISTDIELYSFNDLGALFFNTIESRSQLGFEVLLHRLQGLSDSFTIFINMHQNEDYKEAYKDYEELLWEVEENKQKLTPIEHWLDTNKGYPETKKETIEEMKRRDTTVSVASYFKDGYFVVIHYDLLQALAEIIDLLENNFKDEVKEG